MRKILKRHPAPRARGCAYFCEGLESRTLLSGALLVKDVNPGTLGTYAQPIARLGTTVIFAENDGIHGEELYKSTGTSASTSMIEDLTPGAGDGILLPFRSTPGATYNSAVYFSSLASGRPALWKTDGTAGTTLVKQLSQFTDMAAGDFATASSKLFFNVQQTSGASKTLWVSDGTANGTLPLSQIVPALSGFTTDESLVVNNKLFFTVRDSTFTNRYLYVTDGTQAGTILLRSLPGDQGLFSAGTKLLFSTSISSSYSVWASDGTVAGTISIKSSGYMISYGSGVTTAYMLFQEGGGYSLYSTNGTAAGTTLIKTLFKNPRPGIGTLSNGWGLFVAEVGTTYTLFRTDGTSAGTIPLQPVDAANDATFAVYDVGSNGVFTGYDAVNGTSVWKSDGSVAGTVRLPINPGTTTNPFYFLGGSPVYFSADDGVHGNELWKSDGTVAGTALVADVNLLPASSSPSNLTNINGKLWFAGKDLHGTQPWMSDGTAAGTTPASIDPSNQFLQGPFVALGSKVFYVGRLADFSSKLYSTSGSSATAAINAAGQPSGAATPVVFNNAVYFTGFDNSNFTYGVWKTDGTVAGTALAPLSSTATTLSDLTVAGTFLYGYGLVSGNNQIFSVNSSNQVVQLTNFTGLSSLLSDTAVLNGKLYFLINAAAGVQLWQSNGTAAGTTLVKQLDTVSTTNPYAIVVSNSTLYITVTDSASTTSTDLYKSDGTGGGTTVVKVLTNISQPNALVGANGHVAFITNSGTGSNFDSVWFSDGTSANTLPLMPGPSSDPSPYFLQAAGNLTYFDATDVAHGTELWQTDGTVAGTVVIDINPGPASSMPTGVAQIGGVLYVGADDGIHGAELLKIYNQDVISGTPTADAITLSQNADHAHIDWKIGSTTGQLPINDPAGLTINGNGSNDIITLSGTAPLPNILQLNGTFTINGLAGTNPLANTALDINASTVFITYTSDPLTTIRGYLKNGYNAGLWTGTPTATTGVISSAAAAGNAGHYTAIGYADSADGLVALPANTIELKYTLYGDTGLTGTVGFADFMRMTQHFTMTSQTWGKGDFNYDGLVDSADFNLLQPNYGTVLPAPAPAMTPIVVAPLTLTQPTRVAILPPVQSPVRSSAPVAMVADAQAIAKHRKHGRRTGK